MSSVFLSSQPGCSGSSVGTRSVVCVTPPIVLIFPTLARVRKEGSWLILMGFENCAFEDSGVALAKQGGKSHTLSVHQLCMKFSSVCKMTLLTNPAVMPEGLGLCSPIDLGSFYLSPFSSEENQ